MTPTTAGGFVRTVSVAPGADTGWYPFTLPAVRSVIQAGGLELDPGVTFLVGDNGTGKSTLVEALAVAAGFNAEGGSQSFRFATRATESSLGDALMLRWGHPKPRTGYFLRAESFDNVATEIENLERVDPGLLAAYGGQSLHERSHGESFLDLVVHRFGPNGFYLLDEPEVALSVRGCLAMLTRITDLVKHPADRSRRHHRPGQLRRGRTGHAHPRVQRDGSLVGGGDLHQPCLLRCQNRRSHTDLGQHPAGQYPRRELRR